MTGFDLSTISDCYIGSTQASEIYYGATKIWPTAVDYSREYLTIESLENGNSIRFTKYARFGDLYYSTDKITWNVYSESISLDNEQKVYFKGNLRPAYQEPNPLRDAGIGVFASTKNYDVYGNIMSLLYSDNFIGQTSLELSTTEISNINNYTFYRLFKSCLINASNLILPATTLTKHCYDSMFSGCTSLTIAPSLPATTLANWCYYQMFDGCTSLTTTPELSATTLASYCYARMFMGCTSLTTAPVLPVTTLTNGCYHQMFYDCTSLTTAPELPATTLADSCYDGMFYGCTSLTTAPELSATTLADSCYHGMFSVCTSLTIAPVLPATTLASQCYSYMFTRCTSLTTVPELPATTLVYYCYSEMFYGCTSLNEVHCDATDISATDCLTDWLAGVSQTGDFYKPSTTTYPTGASGIPSGWTIHSNAHDYSQDYLTLEALEAGTFTWTDTGNSRSISYSTDDGSTWTTLTAGSTTPTIAANSKVLLKATLGAGNFNGNGTISSSGRFNAMGNIMSLVGGDNFNNLTVINDYQFNTLFRNCTKLIDASNLILPATTMRICCYRSMFQACSSLTTAPQLPATTLYLLCYQNMFQNCSSLTTAPTLPATTLAMQCYVNMFNGCRSLTTTPTLPATTLVDSCYASMFQNCSSLTTAPELPATTLASSCYNYMFFGCTSLTTAPELPATILASSCYTSMFYGCKNLNSIKCLATDISASNCTNNWVQNVASSGTFVKDSSMSSWTTGTSGIPSGWTVTDNTSS
jgi:hypothetical protein